MRKTKPVFLLLFSLLLAAVLSISALAAEPALKNGELSGNGTPEGWSVLAYLQECADVSSSDGVAALSAEDFNDIRLTQLVEVEPDTVYLLSGEIAADRIAGGRGACLSVDNYSIDGAYIYSDGITGSCDWKTVTLAFRTGDDQRMINVALRLGGYSELSRGTARFRNIRLERAADGITDVQSLTAGYSASHSEPSGGITEARKIQLKSYLHLFVVLSVAAGVFLLFGVYRNRDSLTARTITGTNTIRYFILAVLLATALRSVLASLWGGHDTDMSCWMGWGNYIANNGTADFYTAPGHEWYDYPPGYMLVLGLLARIVQVLKIPSGTGSAAFAYMLPAWLADIATAAVLMREARRERFSSGWVLLLGLLVIFQPAGVVLSGAWGQIDSILTLFLVLSFLELVRGRRVSAGALYGLAVMIKWQALIYGPVLAAAYFFHIRSKKDLRDTALGVLAAIGVMLCVSLPFKGGQKLFWFVEKFFSAAGGYDYASVEAYNFLALLDGNWAPAGNKMILGISYKAFGTAAILIAVVLSVYIQFRDMRRSLPEAGKENGAGTLFLSAGACMYIIFTFGHYMHERYVYPVIILLLFVFVFTGESRYLFCSLLLSAILFLNEITAMYVISNLASAAVRSTREHRAVVTACSLAETVSFLYFAWVMISRGITENEEVKEHA